MATLANKKKLVPAARESQKERPRKSQSRNTSFPTINEDQINQVSEKIGGKVIKNLSQEFSWSERRILGALSELDEFLLNPQVRTQIGTVPQTSRNINTEKLKPTEDRSQKVCERWFLDFSPMNCWIHW